MKSILIFYSSYSEDNLIPGLKEQVKNYLGSRLIEDECIDEPKLTLKYELNNEDYTEITQMIEKLNSQSLSILVIENTQQTNPMTRFIIPLTLK